MTTEAPATMKARAMPRPMPLVDPVTSATLRSSALIEAAMGCETSTFMMILLRQLGRITTRSAHDGQERLRSEMPSCFRLHRRPLWTPSRSPYGLRLRMCVAIWRHSCGNMRAHEQRQVPARATAVLSDRASLLYFATLEVIDAITSDAFWKAASRSVMPWRRAM